MHNIHKWQTHTDSKGMPSLIFFFTKLVRVTVCASLSALKVLAGADEQTSLTRLHAGTIMTLRRQRIARTGGRANTDLESVEKYELKEKTDERKTVRREKNKRVRRRRRGEKGTGRLPVHVLKCCLADSPLRR